MFNLWQSEWSRKLRTKLFLVVGVGLVAFGSGAEAAVPAITNIALLPNRQVQLALAVEVGKSYTFEISTNLVDWLPVGDIANVTTNFVVVTDEEAVDNSPVRFYRMREGRNLHFDFQFMHFAAPGQFSGAALTPSLQLPLFFRDYSAMFDVEGDEPYPAAAQVFFTGPAGSGLASAPASSDNSGEEDGDAWYQSPFVVSTVGAPAGTWTVNYRGTNMTFVKDLQPLARLVIAVPTVTLDNGLVQSVSWIYRDRTTGDVLSAPPAFMQSIQVQIEGQTGRIYDSPWDWDPAQTVHVLSSPVAWSTVRGVNMGYNDREGNHYVLFFMRQ